MTSLPPISPLRGLLAVTKLMRSGGDLPELLTAIARTVAESLGYRTVVVNLYRPAWDDFCVTTVHGNEAARALLLGQVRRTEEWTPLLEERFERRGAYVVPAGTYDWDSALGGRSYVPDVEPAVGADAWHPEDALFLPMRHTDGHLVGVLSVDEPLSGRRPSDEELDVLVALADHAALAVQSAQEAAEAERHRVALERLLGVSSRLTGEPAADEILRAVCAGVRDALGFQNVLAALREPESGRLDPRAAVGWNIDEVARRRPVYVRDIEGLIDPEFEVQGCYLLPNDEAARRIAAGRQLYVSEQNGLGPWAWNHHWLLVPLHSSAGEVIGVLWADEPRDRLLPSHATLQALRVFANQAAAAVTASANLNEVRFLADHDPLTRLLNRRAFVDRLEGEVARATRYGHSFCLVLADLDGFKELNDRFGHPAGDEALQVFARTLQAGLRRGDEAFRIGGDEFALLLAEASEGDAREVVRRVVDECGTVRASFGVASCPDDAGDSQTLFRLADAALYEAKRTGSGLQFVA
ncbi:MAG TPA: sensor domain-containing diguanylate cyclase [Gaiellaceae bacterium]|jgi:diguanylate cyclase (GGDEF)-like protein|nr:sensor domain-containing diguanylate cyclase [Gaiellaceae bacterium]